MARKMHRKLFPAPRGRHAAKSSLCLQVLGGPVVTWLTSILTRTALNTSAW